MNARFYYFDLYYFQDFVTFKSLKICKLNENILIDKKMLKFR